MTVNDLIVKLLNIKPELREKEFLIQAKNGQYLPPEIKFYLKDRFNPLDKSEENVEFVTIAAE